MIDFTNLKALTIPEGAVKKITRKSDGALLWEGISYVNQITLSIGTDKKPYNNGQGWKANTRLNSSGNETAATGVNVTGFIPVKQNDVVYMKGIKFSTSSSYVDWSYLALYNGSFTMVMSSKPTQLSSASYLLGEFTYDASGNATSFKVVDRYNDAGTKTGGYIRISALGVDANAVITVNQPIT